MDDRRAVELRGQIQAALRALQDGEHIKAEARRLSRTAKQYVTAMQATHDAASRFHTELQAFGFKEGQKDDNVIACGVTLAQLEALTHSLSEEKVNISEAKEKLSNSRRQVDSAFRKQLEHKADGKGDADPKLHKSLEDGVKVLEELINEGARRADLWDKAARHEINAALASYMRQAYNTTQKSTACMRGWDSKLEGDRRGSINMRGAPAMEKNETPSLKQGYMYMRVTSDASWSLRWFVLDSLQQGGHLHWYKSWHTSSTPQNSIDCALLSVRPQSEEQKQKGYVDLQSPRQALQLKAPSPRDIDEWIEAFKTAIASQLANAGNKSLASRVDAARNMGILNTIRECSAANNTCVDCGAPAPEWAAINHGVLICIECSGVHRSLGTHISKVRSFTLDNWDAESVEVMKLIGNERANLIWESHMPPNYRKPESTSKRLLKEVYISCKWSERLFVEKSEKTKEQLIEALVAAVTQNDVATTARLVAQRSDVTAALPGDAKQRHLLHIAVEAKAAPMAEFLLQNGADAMQGDAEGVSPLVLAVRSGNVLLATLLFSRISGSVARDRARLLEAAEASKDAHMLTLVTEKVGPEASAAATLQVSPDGITAPAGGEGKGASPRRDSVATSSPSQTRAATVGDKKGPTTERTVDAKVAEAKAEKDERDSKEQQQQQHKDNKETPLPPREKPSLLRRITSLRGSFMPPMGEKESPPNRGSGGGGEHH